MTPAKTESGDPESADPSGFVVPVYKPRGITSTQVVRSLKRAGRFRRIGHGGTLDPLAEGVLPIFVGPAARLTEFLHAQSKAYLAVVLFGAVSSTCDLGGRVTDSSPRPPAPWQIRAALDSFRGPISQVPPRYSAVRIGGRRAYSRARAGEAVKIPAREVVIHRLDAREFDYWGTSELEATGRFGRLGGHGRLVAALDIECGSGTYVRALARDLGQALGCGALLAGLLRTRVGPFAAADALSLPQAESLARAGVLPQAGHSPDRAAGSVAPLLLGSERARRFLHGAVTALDLDPGPRRIYAPDGRFLGMGEVDGDRRLRPLRVLASPDPIP